MNNRQSQPLVEPAGSSQLQAAFKQEAGSRKNEEPAEYRGGLTPVRV